jgi:molybdenum cofactor biosynthesis enzyme
MASGLTHLTARNRPTMVDVGDKEVTRRVASAEARIRLPRAVLLALRKSGHRDHRRGTGRQTHRGADSVLPSAAARQLQA